MSKKIRVILAVLVAVIIATSALVVGVAALDNEPALEIKAANVSFESTVHLWYCVGYENIDNPEDIQLLVWRESAVDHVDNCVKGTESAALSSTEDVDEDGLVGKAFDYDALTAADMTEFVYARAYTVVDGEAVYSPVVKYSILQYALNMLGKTGTATDDAELAETLEAMLVYGAASQKLFDTNLDRLATEDYVKISTTEGVFADGAKSGLFKLGQEVKLYADATDEKPYVRWTNADGKLVGSGAEYTFYAKGNVKLTATITDEATSFGAYKHVVIVGVDGAGDFYWSGNASTPNIDTIFANGAITRTMKTNAPTSSGPSWTSITHGSLVEHHGVNDNSLVEGATGIPFPLKSKYPSFLRLAKEAYPNSKVEAIYGWQAFDNILEDGVGIAKTNPAKALEQSVYEEGVTQQARIDKQNTVNALTSINSDEMPSVLFLHYGNVDTVGHTDKWNSSAYHTELTKVDGYIGQIYAALEAKGVLEDTLFIVTSDHGGYDGDTRHGGISDAEQMAMFAAKGKTVKAGQIGEMENRDVAAVALMALGIAAPDTYTAKVPSNLFNDVDATARKIYNDPDSTRYHLTEQTPAQGNNGYVTNFVSNNLSAYITFDGNITVNGNGGLALGEQKGTLAYEPGYFGEAISLEHGSFQLNNFTPGTDSFTMALWVKAPAVNLESPLIANRSYSNLGLTDYPGFILHGIRNSDGHQLGVRFYNNNTAYNANTQLPSDYQYGWMHVTMIVDRANGKIGLCYDFGDIQWTDMPAEMAGKSMTTPWNDLWFGVDADGGHYTKSDFAIDEFMIFDGAISRNELNDLCEYYGKKTSVPDEATVVDILKNNGKDVTNSLHFDFNNSTNNDGTYTGNVTNGGTISYTSGVNGNALQLGQGKGGYVQIPEYQFTEGKSYSMAFWLQIMDDTQPGNNQEYEPIISNVPVYGSAANGFTFMVNTIGKNFFFHVADGNKTNRYYTGYTAADTENLTYSEDFVGNWHHVTLTVNVADTGTTYCTVYIDFVEVFKAEYTNAATWNGEYNADINGETLTIGQYSNGDFVNPLDANIDEMLIIEDALTADDIAAMKDFYGVN